jgi:hypothetical protein
VSHGDCGKHGVEARQQDWMELDCQTHVIQVSPLTATQAANQPGYLQVQRIAADISWGLQLPATYTLCLPHVRFA